MQKVPTGYTELHKAATVGNTAWVNQLLNTYDKDIKDGVSSPDVHNAVGFLILAHLASILFV